MGKWKVALIDNLVSYWSFDSDASDDHGSNDGSVSGASNVAGKVSNSYNFDGFNDYITVSDDSSLDFATSDISISFWMNWDVQENRYIIIKQPDEYNNLGWGFRMTAAYKPAFEIDDGTDHFDIQGATALSTGTWHHVVVVIDRDNASNCKMYVDGSDDTGTTNGTITDVGDISNTDDVYIARDAKENFVYYDGQLDEIGIWDKVLSSSEVTELYNGGVPYDYLTHSRFADIEAWWRMGDDPEDDLTSLTGVIKDQKNANDGLPINTEAGDKVEDVP